MTGSDRSVGALLEIAAGEPPHDVSVDAVLARARRQRAALLAQGAGALAVVVAVATVTVVMTRGTGTPQVRLGQEPSASPSAPTVPTACTAATTTAEVAGSQGAAGTLRWVVRLRSTADSPCTLDGYPALRFRTAGGWLSVTAVHDGFPDLAGAPTRVELTAGGSAGFVAYWSDVPAPAPCRSFDAASVTLPGDTAPVALAGSGCVVPTSVRVGPVRAWPVP